MARVKLSLYKDVFCLLLFKPLYTFSLSTDDNFLFIFFSVSDGFEESTLIPFVKGLYVGALFNTLNYLISVSTRGDR